MSDDQVLFVADTLLASAFYYGLCGGILGSALIPVGRAAFRAVRRLFEWR